MYTQPMVTIELEEYQQLKRTIEDLSKPAEGTELTELEHQEATGLLLLRSLENPRLFSQGMPDIQIGKYKAIFALPSVNISETRPTVRVKFVRT